LNIVSKILFEETLFTIPSLKDDLQRRSELIQNVGSSFKWDEPRKGEPDEYYWWDIGEYKDDASTLDYIVQCLIHSIPTDDELTTIETRMRKLVDYFINRIGFQLSHHQMSDLFSNPPAHDFEYVLQTSINKALDEVTLEQPVPQKKKKRKLEDSIANKFYK
ncbi:MAG TPA: hypothetical protein VEP90_14185, partial [Methylomirabilota bacterium]|nr:hypothetical protein [Methylomirabilota bacterium]